jgi:cytochrome c oxidase cbb3-type subunit 1
MAASNEVIAGFAVAPREDAEAAQKRTILRFLVVSVSSLFVGTVMGVMQTFPPVVNWIHGAGMAGHMIDPLAHAHVNLVGGVTMGMMGLFYYVLPRLLGRPVHSALLGEVSFWCSTCGVAIFFSSLVILGIIEGRMVHAGMSYPDAKASMGAIHPVAIITGAMLMGLGYWTFIANVYLTVFTNRGSRKRAPAA